MMDFKWSNSKLCTVACLKLFIKKIYIKTFSEILINKPKGIPKWTEICRQIYFELLDLADVSPEFLKSHTLALNLHRECILTKFLVSILPQWIKHQKDICGSCSSHVLLHIQLFPMFNKLKIPGIENWNQFKPTNLLFFSIDTSILMTLKWVEQIKRKPCRLNYSNTSFVFRFLFRSLSIFFSIPLGAPYVLWIIFH